MPSRERFLSFVIKGGTRLANYADRSRFVRFWHSLLGVRDSFLSSRNSARILISLFAITLFAHVTPAQNESANLRRILHQNASFDPADFLALQQGEPVVSVLPRQHKQEVSVYGLVRVQASGEVFLQSFLDTMATRSNPAILEIGRFSGVPTLEDLNTLTMESRDVEALRRCVVGDCELKLSASMIDQFQKTVNWHSSDYASQATRRYKLMLLDYVRNYVQRGDEALIEYTDKSTTVSLLEGHRALLASLPTFFHQSVQNGNSLSLNGFQTIENTIVWSKIKFGLKPVLAINHIQIFKSDQEVGPQILILSKQIYANHYFDASIALTGLARNPDSKHGSYLFYENHSLADGLQGLFGKIKRKLIEREAVDGLKGVLKGTKISLDARALNERESGQRPQTSPSWIKQRITSKQLFFLLFFLTVLVMLAVVTYQRKANVPTGKHAG
jgi:hypothetical protein